MTLRRVGFWLGLGAVPVAVTAAAGMLLTHYRGVVDDTAAGLLGGVAFSSWLASLVVACRALDPQKHERLGKGGTPGRASVPHPEP